MWSRATPLGACEGYWLHVRCPCRLVHVPVRLLLKRGTDPRSPVGDVAARLRCERCGERGVEVLLVHYPAGPPHYVVGKGEPDRVPLVP